MEQQRRRVAKLRNLRLTILLLSLTMWGRASRRDRVACRSSARSCNMNFLIEDLVLKIQRVLQLESPSDLLKSELLKSELFKRDEHTHSKIPHRNPVSSSPSFPSFVHLDIEKTRLKIDTQSLTLIHIPPSPHPPLPCVSIPVDSQRKG